MTEKRMDISVEAPDGFRAVQVLILYAEFARVEASLDAVFMCAIAVPTQVVIVD